MQKSQRVRVKQDAKFTIYRGKVGTITAVFTDLEGRARYMVRFDDGGGSVYHAEELETITEKGANNQ